jgi:hypothetical protein
LVGTREHKALRYTIMQKLQQKKVTSELVWGKIFAKLEAEDEKWIETRSIAKHMAAGPATKKGKQGKAWTHDLLSVV